MPKLHELLAAERTVVATRDRLLADTDNKFGKPHFFQGHTKTLKMIEDDPSNEATEQSAREDRQIVTTVADTLKYLADFWIKAEALLADKNAANQSARAKIVLPNGETFGPPEGFPVDELMGLESRLTALRGVLAKMPTQDATRKWEHAGINDYIVQSTLPEVTTKTKKIKVPFQLAPATDKHPAQVQALDEEKTVGTFTKILFSGEATSQGKADVLSRVDELIAAAKQARVRANETEVSVDSKEEIKRMMNWVLRPVYVHWSQE